MKITIVQSTVVEDKWDNLNHVKELLQNLNETDIIVLPEMFNSPYENEKFFQNAITESSSYLEELGELAKKHQAYLIAGSVPEQDEGKYYNTSFVFNADGVLLTKYRKIHLFEITYPNGTTYKESDVLTPGEDIEFFDTPFGRIGIMICFDIRFPRLAEALRQQGTGILIVPAAFNTYTGPHHWELAFRSRSVDNQLFTVGVSPSAESVGKYQYYGHSIVVNPFGEILFQAENDEVVHTIEIDMNDVQKIRKAFPILSSEKVI